MKHRASFILLLLILSLWSCEGPVRNTGDGPPVIFTSSITELSGNSAVSGGFDLDDRGSEIYQKGICWDTLPNPEVTSIVHLHSDEGVGVEEFSSTMEWLQDETEYFVRAYAINDEGVTYGNEVGFTTPKLELDIPCNVVNNTLSFNSIVLTNVRAGWDMPLYGDYGLRGNSLNIDFTIGFEKPPRSGVYQNVGFNTPNDFLWIKECTMSATNIGIGPGGLVYVNRISEDNYSITFCDIVFSAGVSNFPVSGNLTTE